MPLEEFVSAQAAFGAEIGYGASAAAGTPIERVTNIGTPDPTLATVETTTHDSPGAWVRRTATLWDGGTFTVSGYWKPELVGQQAVRAHKDAMDSRQMYIDYADGWGLTFYAICKKAKPGDAPVDGVLTMELEFELDGEVEEYGEGAIGS